MPGKDVLVEPDSNSYERVVLRVHQEVLILASFFEISTYPEIILKSIQPESLPQSENESGFLHSEVEDLSLSYRPHPIIL